MPRISDRTRDITGLRFSPDGKTIVSGNEEEIRLWDTKTGHETALCIPDRSTDHINFLFSPDSSILISACARAILNFEIGELRTAPGEYTTRIYSENYGGTFQLWDTHSNKDNNHSTKLSINEISIGQVVRALAFSSDGRTLVIGAWRGSIMLWDVETGQQIAKFIDAKGSIAALKFSPDGRIIAKGGESGVVELWDVETKSRIWYNRDAHSSSVSHFAFTPDQKTLVSGSAAGTIFIWNLNNMKHNGR